MDNAVSEPLVFMHLLADRKGRLSALQFDFGDGDLAELALLDCFFDLDEEPFPEELVPDPLSLSSVLSVLVLVPVLEFRL